MAKRLNAEHHTAAACAQETEYGEGYNYAIGSPHIRHTALRELLEGKIVDVIQQVLARQQSCAVLEVGAGHGSFTETVLRAGGTPTLTEMSTASFDFLKRKFGGTPEVRVIHDSDGSALLNDTAKFDVILLISVIHHIPDYVGAVSDLCDKVLRPEGIVLTSQDPLWYPRQSKLTTMLSWGSYFVWRLGQGELRRGLRTRWRRLRRIYDDSEPADMVEYHVVRKGVDESVLLDFFGTRFTDVKLDTYFSTPMPALQSFGARYFPSNTFGILAQGRTCAHQIADSSKA
jgi:SAM-dependent methyltransferase